MFLIRSRAYALFIALLCIPALSAKTIIFDLNGVLTETSRWQVAQTIGLSKFIAYALFDIKNPAHLQDHMFDILDTFGKQKTTQNFACHGSRPLPQIMCDWMCDICTGYDIINQANKHISQATFCSTREEFLLKSIIQTAFDPELLAQHMYVIPQGRKLVELCKQAGHRVMILSNLDSLTYKYLSKKEKTKELFDLFAPSDIIISGSVGMIKPHKNIFMHVLQTYNLDSSDCIFIDDQIENTKAAQSCGIPAIVCTSHEQVYSELEEYISL